MCWNCTWGIPEPIANIYNEALRELYEVGKDERVLLSSASHVVWDDFNFDSSAWCLEHFDEYRGEFSDEELAIARWSLEEILKVPEEIRDYLPDGYELGSDQTLFPPDKDHPMVII